MRCCGDGFARRARPGPDRRVVARRAAHPISSSSTLTDGAALCSCCAATAAAGARSGWTTGASGNSMDVLARRQLERHGYRRMRRCRSVRSFRVINGRACGRAWHASAARAALRCRARARPDGVTRPSWTRQQANEPASCCTGQCRAVRGRCAQRCVHCCRRGWRNGTARRVRQRRRIAGPCGPQADRSDSSRRRPRTRRPGRRRLSRARAVVRRPLSRPNPSTPCRQPESSAGTVIIWSMTAPWYSAGSWRFGGVAPVMRRIATLPGVMSP
jgi:hypothetical protein